MRAALLVLALAACNAEPAPGDLGTPDLSVGDLAPGPADLAQADLARVDLTSGGGGGDDGGATTKTDRGQCYTHAHCGAGGTCRVEAPGGLCAGCGASTAGCPMGWDDACYFDVCQRDCAASVSVCLAGQVCASAMGDKYCALKTCADSTACPAIYECRALTGGATKYCQRVLCPSGTGCPAGTTCTATGTTPTHVCVEDHLAF